MSTSELARAGARTTTSDPAKAQGTALPWRVLLVLASAVFLSITIEMLPTGLLPEMSADLGVGEPLVGLLVSVFAFTVVVTSTPLTAITRRMSRRTLLTAVLVLLAASTLLSAVVPEYWMLIGVRVVGGIAHGVFWALVGAYPARVVAEGQLGRAISIVLGGGTIALIAGVPLATALGQALGWRPAFAVVAGLTFAGALLMRAVLPADGATSTVREGAVVPDEPAASSAARAHAASARPAGTTAVLVVCVVTAIVMTGQYAALTYIAPILTDVVGAPASAVAPLLFASGIAGAAGLAVAGTRFARNGIRTLVLALAVIAASLVVLTSVPALWPAVFAYLVWGFAFGAVPPLLQTRLLQAAAPERRDAASALYTTGFNIGIGGGALIGGLLFGSFGVGSIPLAFVVLAVLAAVIVASSTLRMSRVRVAAATGSVRTSSA
ncbi:putative MFS family arabinose efflux permease [Agromyces flavus]|uniref:MFS family arabinose efflux permease n=1 Tax=Agromyces flavus TaxID=589382 RepID=A0A1H1M0N6_9MICO|nr:MFS transporter [Agromyces flavus]MCP2368680.1 putative MFS family arabinose efflux permease [Agromyces flavus]SDR79855.1 Predicted arabinose efflux permease, MFS family [Agromyces flavus]